MKADTMAYNRKKYIKFTQKRTKSGAGMLAFIEALKNLRHALNSVDFRPQKKITMATI
jgi:hypothetical protein